MMQSLAGPSQGAAELYIGQSWSQGTNQENVKRDIASGNRILPHNKKIGDGPSPSCSSSNSTVVHSACETHIDLYKELQELYRELGQNPCEYPHLHPQSFLLETLVQRNRLNTMVIKLHPGNKGYSFLFKFPKKEIDAMDGRLGNVDFEFETKCWFYEDDDLLRYIDNGELPSLIIDMIDTHYSHLFYSNVIIAEIWDYRQSYANLICDINYVLLKPSTQSVIVDVAALTSTGDWSRKDRLALEAELIKAAAPPLCLDPDPVHGEIAITAQQTSQLFNTRSIKRKARKFSQVAINRKRKLNQYAQYHGPDLCSSLASRQKSSPNNCKKYKQSNKVFMPAPSSLELPELSPPSSMDPFIFPEHDRDVTLTQQECLLEQINHADTQLIEEYIFNMYKKEGLVCIDNIKLSILQRLISLELFGELRVEYYQKDGVKTYRTCEFNLGTKAQANRFYDEFKEIVTDEGKECVQITHIEPGKESVVTYTDALKRIAAQYKAVSPSNLQVPRPSQLLSNALLNQSLLNSSQNGDNNIIIPTTSPTVNAAGPTALIGNMNFEESMNMNMNQCDVANTIVQNNNLVNNSVVYKNYVGVMPTSNIASDRQQYSNITLNKPISMNISQNNVSASVPLLALRNQAIRPSNVQDVSPGHPPGSGQSVLATNTTTVVPQTQTRRPGDNLMEKMRAIYRELATQPRITKNANINIKDASYLLQQLVTKEKLGTLIFSFHGSNKGFLISVRSKKPGQTSSTGNEGTETVESLRWPYRESELLSILEKEEFAPVLIKLTTQKYPQLIHDNCLIAEVRDYRDVTPKYKYILLKPDLAKLQDLQRQKAAMQRQLAVVAAAAAAANNSNVVETRKSPLTCQSTSPSAAISAIENSLRNSAQQYQQEKAAAAASLKACINISGSSTAGAVAGTTTNNSSDAAIRSLLNNTPAPMTNTAQRAPLQKIRSNVFPQRRLSLSPGTSMVMMDASGAPFPMSGFSAVLASTEPSSIPQQQQQNTVNAALFERLIANASPSKKPPQFRMTSSPVQVQTAAGLSFDPQQYVRIVSQNNVLPTVTVSANAVLPRLAARSDSPDCNLVAAGTTMAGFAAGQTVLLNTASPGTGTTALPISLVASGLKGPTAQTIRGMAAGIVSFNQANAPLQLLEALRKPTLPPTTSTYVKPQLTRNAAGKCHLTGAIFKMPVSSTDTNSPATLTSGNSILTLAPQQMEVQNKIQQCIIQQQEQPKSTMNPASTIFENKHRRRSHTGDGS